jgi:UDP-glucose 4-epimerase
MQKILVTGGAGYIGSHVAHALADAGRSVLVIDDLSRGRADMLPQSATFIEGDICDEALLAQVFATHRPDGIVHLAARSLVPESVTDPHSYYRVNVEGTRRLVEAAGRAGTKGIVFSSTASVYGAPERMPIGEDTPKDPQSPYGATKLACEWVLRDTAAAGGVPWTALRYFNAAGADPAGRCGQVGPASHLVKIAAQVVVGARPEIAVYGEDYPTADGTCVRDYVHVSDIAAAHVLALDRLAGGGDPVACNIGYGKGASVREILDVVEELYPGSLKIVTGPRRPGDVPELIASTDRARRELGWVPAHDSLHEIVRTAVEWERGLQAG